MIPMALILVHAALVALAGILIAASGDPETGMIWSGFYFIDYPISKLLFNPPPQLTTRASGIPAIILALGTIQWGLIGLAIQWLLKAIRAQ